MNWMETFAAAIGRPKAIEGEAMVVSDGLMASQTRPAQGGVYFLPIDEILRREGWKTYKEMMYDDQVKASMHFKKILVVGRDWSMLPANDTPQAKEIAEYVTWCLNKIDFTHTLKEAASAFENGYSLAEIVWDRYPVDAAKFPTLAASSSNCVMFDKIAHRDPRDLQLQMDQHGNYMGVLQLSMGQNITLPANKTWLYSYNKKFGNLYGESDLRSAYRSWWAKKFIINFWNVFLERMGQPMMMMKYPQGASDPLKATLMKILKNLASKTEVLVPDGVSVELVEATRGGTATYKEALAYYDNSIARSVLLPALFGLGGEGGSDRGNDAQSLIQARMIFKMADDLSKEISLSLMCQVIMQLVAMNYGQEAAETLMPKFFWQDYSEYQATLIADEIRQLHTAGIIDMDQDDVNYVRSLTGMRQRGAEDKPDEVVRPEALPPPANGTPPPPASQGNSRADKGGSAKGDSTTK